MKWLRSFLLSLVILVMVVSPITSSARPCEGPSMDSCAGSVVLPAGTGYNITFDGKWSDRDREEALEGAEAIGYALARFTGHTPSASFNEIYGPTIFRTSTDLGGYYAVAYGNVILFRPGTVTARLTVHELGHTFTHLVPGDQSPVSMLARNGVRTLSGKLVTGPIYGDYNRYAGNSAPLNGYWTDGYALDGAQWHPKWMSGGNQPDEDFSDIFLNWVYNSFVPNPSGWALYAWTEAHMPIWVSLIPKHS